MEYITFIHNNADSEATSEEWEVFFTLARESGSFRGGSAMGKRTAIGTKSVPDATEHIGGYMRFDAEDPGELAALLSRHPIVIHGGTIEIVELPRT